VGRNWVIAAGAAGAAVAAASSISSVVLLRRQGGAGEGIGGRNGRLDPFTEGFLLTPPTKPTKPVAPCRGPSVAEGWAAERIATWMDENYGVHMSAADVLSTRKQANAERSGIAKTVVRDHIRGELSSLLAALTELRSRPKGYEAKAHAAGDWAAVRAFMAEERNTIALALRYSGAADPDEPSAEATAIVNAELEARSIDYRTSSIATHSCGFWKRLQHLVRKLRRHEQSRHCFPKPHSTADEGEHRGRPDASSSSRAAAASRRMSAITVR